MSRSYLGVDLAESAIERLEVKLEGIDGADAVAMDILARPPRQECDAIYAVSVLHHFRHLDEILRHLEGHLKPGGRIAFYWESVTDGRC